jgi:hypothetical protein
MMGLFCCSRNIRKTGCRPNIRKSSHGDRLMTGMTGALRESEIEML